MLSYLFYFFRYCSWWFGNLVRGLRKAPDYVLFTLEGDYPELPQPPANFIQRRLIAPKISLLELAELFRVIAYDRRVRGVVIHLRPLNMPASSLDTLRDQIQMLRKAGKHVVAWASNYDRARYYLACAADEIYLLPGGMLDTLGLHQRYLYLADALERLGLRAEFQQITPFKSAGDLFTRRGMSEEVRQMANWLIDATYAEFVSAISSGRGVDKETAAAIIDQSPCTDLKAKEIHAVDEILHEEDLPERLQHGEKPARILMWETASSGLKRPPPPRPGRYVALISIEGVIIDGYSQKPPFRIPIPLPFIYSERAGDLSVVQTARRVMADSRAAAVVLYIDSRGGSATASEAMHAALRKIATKKPMVVVMGPYAASGGYWVATPGGYIFAQPNTITGSIGVLNGKITNAGLLERLFIGREDITRGKTALVYDFDHPFTEEERASLWESIERIYDMFLDKVSDSRKMSRAEVDAIGGGRVWTGRQAQEKGLVDELGSLEQGLAKARQLGKLDSRAPVRLYFPGRQPLPPLPDAASTLSYALDGLRLFNQPTPLCLCPIIPDDEG